MEDPEFLHSPEWKNFIRFNQDNWNSLAWYRRIEKEFWKWHILKLEAEAELTYWDKVRKKEIQSKV